MKTIETVKSAARAEQGLVAPRRTVSELLRVEKNTVRALSVSDLAGVAGGRRKLTVVGTC